MENNLFNPFGDRLSRDIRNDLSEGFAAAVETGDTSKLQQTVEFYRSKQLTPSYTKYIDDRFARYMEALHTITGKITDPIEQAVVLWNLRLFFEVHEVLEHAWYTAKGPQKDTLQALIRAAGVYIKLEYGFSGPASRIAAKAVPVLEANIALLRSYFGPQKLIAALKEVPEEKIPPTLSKYDE